MFEDLLTFDNLTLIVKGILIVVAMIFSDRIVRRVIKSYSNKLKIEEHAVNILNLIARIVIVAIGLSVALSMFGLPGDWFISVSALSGAAIGFASTQTVGNFLAGLYIMISKPFMVNDYVKIGGKEGEIKEITINYTKIFTPTYNLLEIPNRKVLDSLILNYSEKKNIIDYSFEVGFSHTETNKELIDNCISPGIDSFYEKFKDVLPEKPEFSLYKSDRLGRTFLIRLFFPEKKVKLFYDIQPELLKKIIDNWDIYKNKKSQN